MSILTSAARIWLTRSWRAFEFTGAQADDWSFSDARHLGLYVHIPFCRTLCAFCPYCKRLFDPALAARYTEALLAEIDLVGGRCGGVKTKTTSLYFGGGSPALLIEDLARIIARLQRYFIIQEGIGVELHPQDVTVKNLRKLKEAGVTKISIGIQSFQAGHLAALGRNEENFEALFAALAEEPFETISMDFIFALPGQTFDDLQRDVDTAFANGANHIAVYPFIDFTFTERTFPKMRDRAKKALLYRLVAYCEEKGYIRDSIWTFSKTGRAAYSSMTRENFLGFGCSATTLLRDRFKINTFDVDHYIARLTQGRLPTALTLHFTPRQRMVYFLFWAAYTLRLDSARFLDFFGHALESRYGTELYLARLLGWLRKTPDGYEMTTRGSWYYHWFEHFYTLSYIDRMWHLMRREAFPEALIIR